MNDDLYAQEILHHYKHPQNKGSLKVFDAEARDSNPLCGDSLHIQLKLDSKGRVSAIAFDGPGCAISQASASMVTELAKGKTPKQIIALKHGDVAKLFGTKLSPTRLKCALLSL
ncbi:Fe-S cluster protein, partial [Candidatus Micrarchaeota archaeon CG1_02_55_22]